MCRVSRTLFFLRKLAQSVSQWLSWGAQHRCMVRRFSSLLDERLRWDGVVLVALGRPVPGLGMSERCRASITVASPRIDLNGRCAGGRSV